MGLNTELLSYIENDDEHKCKLFIENTCGCRLDYGSPCSSLFHLMSMFPTNPKLHC